MLTYATYRMIVLYFSPYLLQILSRFLQIVEEQAAQILPFARIIDHLDPVEIQIVVPTRQRRKFLFSLNAATLYQQS